MSKPNAGGARLKWPSRFPPAALFALAFVAACGEQEVDTASTQETASTFNMTREAFISAFNQEAAGDEGSGLSECGTETSGTFSCRTASRHNRTEAQAEAGRLGVDIPGLADYNGEYVTLETQDGNLSRVMIAGDRRVYGAVQMVGALANAARVLGGDDAREELADDVRLIAFMEGVGLIHAPPRFGTQVAISRSYAEIACTLATEDPLVYACYLTPPGARLNIHLR